MMAKTFKYNLLLFASYYNKVVSEEGTTVNEYSGNRKQINNLKAALLGERHQYNVAQGSDRSTSVNGALAFMLRGLERYQGNRDGFSNQAVHFLTLSRSSAGMGKGREFVYVHKDKDLGELKGRIAAMNQKQFEGPEKVALDTI